MTALADRIRELAAEPGITNIRIAELAGSTQGYVSQVLRKAGTPATSRRRSNDPAVTRYRTLRPARTSRPCICCGSRFWSEGPHNRMCAPCRLQPSEIV